MFISLTPLNEKGEPCDDIGFNSNLLLNVRNDTDGHGILKFINGDEIKVKQRRKEIVQRINQATLS